MDDPPKSKTTMRISTNLGTASQYANSPMTVIELKGRTRQEKGEHYLQLSLMALKELAGLLEDARLSERDRAAYNEAYRGNKAQFENLVQLRNELLTQKKSFRSFFVNLFVRESESSRFHKISYKTYSAIRRTSEDIHIRLLPVGPLVASGSLEESNVSVCEESPRDVVEGDVLVKDLPPNETLRGINVDAHTEEQRIEALGILNRIATLARGEIDEDDDDDGSNTIVPSRPPSPSPSFTIIHHTQNIINSVVALNSEVAGATINNGVNKGMSVSVIPTCEGP